MSVLNCNEEELVHVTDILLGAAHVDRTYDEEEVERVLTILIGMVSGHLPRAVKLRFEVFDPDGFDLEKACAGLDFDVKQRNALFSLISRVIEVDDVHAYEESDYLEEVAVHLGADLDEIEPFHVDFIEVKPPETP